MIPDCKACGERPIGRCSATGGRHVTGPSEACPRTGRSAAVCADPLDHDQCPDLRGQWEASR